MTKIALLLSHKNSSVRSHSSDHLSVNFFQRKEGTGFIHSTLSMCCCWDVSFFSNSSSSVVSAVAWWWWWILDKYLRNVDCGGLSTRLSALWTMLRNGAWRCYSVKYHGWNSHSGPVRTNRVRYRQIGSEIVDGIEICINSCSEGFYLDNSNSKNDINTSLAKVTCETMCKY